MNDALSRVAVLAHLLVQQEAEVDELEKRLAAAKARALRTKRDSLPELMREFAITSIGLDDGSKVAVKDDVEARITEENLIEAHAWLREHEFGGLIKTEVEILFGRGEEKAATKVAEALAKKFPNHDIIKKEAVHNQTLKAFIREQMEAGSVVPFDLFSITPFSYAKVTLPKSK